jgi:hypothetical protein
VGEFHPDDPAILSFATLQHLMIPERAALRALALFNVIVCAEEAYVRDD